MSPSAYGVAGVVTVNPAEVDSLSSPEADTANTVSVFGPTRCGGSRARISARYPVSPSASATEIGAPLTYTSATKSASRCSASRDRPVRASAAWTSSPLSG